MKSIGSPANASSGGARRARLRSRRGCAPDQRTEGCRFVVHACAAQKANGRWAAANFFRRDEQRQRHVRDCITSGLTMRWIGPRRCRNEEAACGIEKSGERAIGESQRAEGECPAQQVAARSARFCALMLDGVEYQEEPLINGFCGDFYRAQNDLGSSPSASENPQVCAALLSDLAGGGFDFRQLHLNIIEGSGRAALLGKTPRRGWPGAALPTRTSGTTCAATSPTKIKRDGIAT